MMTRQSILDKINAYLNHQITLPELVAWAESLLVEPHFPETENADLSMDILMYLGAADTRGFPLTLEILTDVLERLGGSVKVIVEVA
jgi:hypothetical protein